MTTVAKRVSGRDHGNKPGIGIQTAAGRTGEGYPSRWIKLTRYPSLVMPTHRSKPIGTYASKSSTVNKRVKRGAQGTLSFHVGQYISRQVNATIMLSGKQLMTCKSWKWRNMMNYNNSGKIMILRSI